MKRSVKCLLAAIASVIMDASYAAFTYDPEAGTLTDGVWTLHATQVKGSTENLDVNGANGLFHGEADKTYSIDLTEIYDSSGNRYYAVSYKAFSSYTGAYNPANKKGSNLAQYKERLREFIAPQCNKISENGCFMNCINLEKVELAESVIFGDDRPFQGCSMLAEFSPRTLMVTGIRTQTFNGCASLSGEFDFPECTSIGGRAFSGCSLLEKVKILKVQSIADQAFTSCRSLEKVETSDSLTTIRSSAFSGCTSLDGESIRKMLHNGITTLGNSNTDVKSIFSRCQSFEGQLIWDFPQLSSTNVVGENYFNDCTSLESVKFKTPVLEIRRSAFAEIAPGAEVYLHKEVARVYASSAIYRKVAPFPKLILPSGSADEWIKVIGVSNFVLERKDFRNRSWKMTIGASDKTGLWADIVSLMMKDTTMCAKETIDKVDYPRPLDKRIVGFVYFTSGAVPYNGCWILDPRTDGMQLKVR